MVTISSAALKKMHEVALPLVGKMGPPSPSREFLREMLQKKEGLPLAEFIARGRRHGEAAYSVEEVLRLNALAADFVDHHPDWQRKLVAGTGLASLVPGVNVIASPAANILGRRVAEENFVKGTALYETSLQATLQEIGGVYGALAAALPSEEVGNATRVSPQAIHGHMHDLVMPAILKLDEESVGKRFMLRLYSKDEGKSLSQFIARAVDERQLVFTASELKELKDISLAVNPYQPDWHQKVSDAAMVGSLVALPLMAIPPFSAIGVPLFAASGVVSTGVGLHSAQKGADRGADDVAKDVAAGVSEMDAALNTMTRLFAGQSLTREARPTALAAAQETRAAEERPLLGTVRENVQSAVEAAKGAILK